MPLDAVLPAFLIVLVGYYIRSKLSLDIGSLSRVCLYILTPALAFNSLSTSNASFTVAWKLFLGAAVMAPLLWPLWRLTARLAGPEENLAKALTLPSVFCNAGNYGLPVCLFAFGQEGMDLGVIFMVGQTIVISTLGVYIAASSNLDVKAAVKRVLKMPSVYAVAFAFLAKASHLAIPDVLGRPIGLLSAAAVPIYLLTLGMQLSEKTEEVPLKSVVSSSIFRLVVSPAVMAGLGLLLGLKGLPFQILVLEAAMPSPVNATILAREFNARPAAVSRATLLNTVLSVFTLTLWIMLLRAF